MGKNVMITGATGMIGSLVLKYKVTRFLYPVLKLLGTGFSIKSTELATAIFNVPTAFDRG